MTEPMGLSGAVGILPGGYFDGLLREDTSVNSPKRWKSMRFPPVNAHQGIRDLDLPQKPRIHWLDGRWVVSVGNLGFVPMTFDCGRRWSDVVNWKGWHPPPPTGPGRRIIDPSVLRNRKMFGLCLNSVHDPEHPHHQAFCSLKRGHEGECR